jgi:hypothetical protein
VTGRSQTFIFAVKAAAAVAEFEAQTMYIFLSLLLLSPTVGVEIETVGKKERQKTERRAHNSQ